MNNHKHAACMQAQASIPAQYGAEARQARHAPRPAHHVHPLA
jgi:hypothetical protein